jgi:hypothetical protein
VEESGHLLSISFVIATETPKEWPLAVVYCWLREGHSERLFIVTNLKLPATSLLKILQVSAREGMSAFSWTECFCTLFTRAVYPCTEPFASWPTPLLPVLLNIHLIMLFQLLLKSVELFRIVATLWAECSKNRGSIPSWSRVTRPIFETLPTNMIIGYRERLSGRSVSGV